MSVTEIGRRLKKARIDAGLTQAEVAKRLGVSFQTISSYERGINRIDSDTLLKLCEIYRTSISRLLTTPAWSDEMRKEYENSDDERKDQLIELWGCPDFLIERQNNKREPDHSPLSSLDEAVLFAYHRSNKYDRELFDNLIRRYVPSFVGGPAEDPESAAPANVG